MSWWVPQLWITLKTKFFLLNCKMTLEAFLELVYRSSFWLAAVILVAILAYIVYTSLRKE